MLDHLEYSGLGEFRLSFLEFVDIWWRLFYKRAVFTTLDIYVCINEKMMLQPFFMNKNHQNTSWVDKSQIILLSGINAKPFNIRCR
jgi:hypothetical protein